MNANVNTYKGKFDRYMRKTIKNKVYAIALILLGIVGTLVSEESTFLVVTLIFGIPLFFARNNYIN